MSLNGKTVLDEKLQELTEQIIDFFSVISEIWKQIVIDKKQPNQSSLKRLKQLSKRIYEVCEELP